MLGWFIKDDETRVLVVACRRRPNLAYGASAVFPCGVTPALADGWQAPAQEDAH